jgi:hypothetical protein
MLRTAQQNQMALTALADQKANIVLGLGLLMATLSSNRLAQGSLPPALLVLLLAGVMAGLFALTALLPRSSVAPRGAPGGAGAKAFNPLFFGGIATVDGPEYLERMGQIMGTDLAVYTAILTDLHTGARALRRKYQWLRYSYIALVAGMIAAGLALALDLYLGIPQPGPAPSP